jgi:hypothetical protein
MAWKVGSVHESIGSRVSMVLLVLGDVVLADAPPELKLCQWRVPAGNTQTISERFVWAWCARPDLPTTLITGFVE